MLFSPQRRWWSRFLPTGDSATGSATDGAASRSLGPSQCEVCRQWAASRLCPLCIDRFAAPQPRCGRCGLRVATALPACGACLREAPPFSATQCAVDYGFPWDGLIIAFKFHGQPELAHTLAPPMVAAVRRSAEVLPHAVLPVPLSSQRLAQRGYNQAWELARWTAGALRLPAWPEVLSRPLDTDHQASLGRAERQRNLRGAFLVEPAHRARVQGKHLALVDDVMTTGATVREATTELLRAGAARVDVWVLARTPSAAA